MARQLQLKSPAAAGAEAAHTGQVLVHNMEAPAAAPPIRSYHRLGREQSRIWRFIELDKGPSRDMI
jgi:hypothetical protein